MVDSLMIGGNEMLGRLSVLIVVLLAAHWTVPVLAVQPLDVHIEAETAILQTEPDMFIASGDAVDVGLVCESGDLSNLSGHTSGPPEGPFLVIRISKHFVCADGSGTFDVNVIAMIDKTTGESTGNWVVTGGTGAHSDLHGTGRLNGIPVVLGKTVLDIYDGKMH